MKTKRAVFLWAVLTIMAFVMAESRVYANVYSENMGYEIVVTGTFRSQSGCSTNPGIHAYWFEPHEQYIEILSQLHPVSRGFMFYGVRDISKAIGLSGLEIRAIENEIIIGVQAEDVVIRVGNSEGHIEVLEVVSVGRLTRRFQSWYIFLGVVAAIAALGIGCVVWKYARRK